MANPLLTFSSLRPKFSPLVSTTSRSTYPQYSARPLHLLLPLPSLCLFPCDERVVPVSGVQETCFRCCIQTLVRAAGVHVVKSASEAAPARHTGHTAHCSGPDRTARPLPPSPPRTVRGPPPRDRRVPDPMLDRWTTVLSVKNVTRTTLGPRSWQVRVRVRGTLGVVLMYICEAANLSGASFVGSSSSSGSVTRAEADIRPGNTIQGAKAAPPA